MKFYVGLHQPNHAQYFDRCFISVNRILNRKSDFIVNEWILDSGAFSQIYRYGEHIPAEKYATQIKRWAQCGKLVAAVTQDYMCEPFILQRTGRTILEHQQMTVERYRQLIDLVDDVYIMPVLQGYQEEDYVRHIEMYGDLLKLGMWVGVGSVCKRNGSPLSIIAILKAIKTRRPDLKLHGFGLKLTALENKTIRDMLYSCDSMAWSYAARRKGRDANDWREAKRYEWRIMDLNSKSDESEQMTIYH